MSNTFSPLIVPATMAQEDVIRQLLLYFETVFLYAPAENSLLTLPPELNDLCQHYAPVPFGEYLTNFELLIRDMTSHRAEYYGGRLSSLSARESAVDEESVWRLITRLSAGSVDTAQQKTLFHARLLLKLAEIRDQEEQEITHSLTSLDAQGQALLHDLTNGDEGNDTEVEAMVDHNQPLTGALLEKRIQAWGHLFLADPRREDHWLLAASQEIMAVLSDYATTSLNETPALILSLPLPLTPILGISPSQYRAERTAWQTRTRECQAAVRAAVREAAMTGELGDGSAIEQELLSQLKQFNAWGKGELGSLDFWLLPISLPRLFAKITRRTEPPTTAQGLAHCVVAVPRRGSR